MNEHDLDDLKLTSSMEQANSALANVAVLLGDFYEALLQAGVPPHIADDIIREQHAIFAGAYRTGEK